MKKKVTKDQLRGSGWKFTNTYYANCEVWRNGKQVILYDPVIERIIHQYTEETKDCVRLGSGPQSRPPFAIGKE